MSLISKIQALITAANAKTGETDATLTEAMQTLVDGYGQGADPVIIPLSVAENGTYTAPEGVDGYSPVMVNVQGGGINPLLYATNVENLFRGTNSSKTFLPQVFSVEFGDKTASLHWAFNYTTPENGTAGSKLSVSASAQAQITSIQFAFKNSEWETIELDFNTSHVTDWQEAFCWCTNTKEIIGELNFSSATVVIDMFGGFGTFPLEEMRFSSNSLALSINLSHLNKLSNDSIVSVANGLNEATTGKTLTLHATPKAKCSTIMGNVAMDESNTYHIFTEDAGGNTTLQDFITNVKGWTIA